MVLLYEYLNQIKNQYGERFEQTLRNEFKNLLGNDCTSFHFNESVLNEIKNENLKNKIDIRNIDSKSFENVFIQYDKELYELMKNYGFKNISNIEFEVPKNLFIIIDDNNKISVCEKTSINGEYALKNFQKLVFENNDFYKVIQGKKILLDIEEKQNELEYNEFER